jgi:hypothetical protein
MTRVCIGVVLAAGSAALGQGTMYGLAGNVAPLLQRLDPSSGAVLETLPVSGHQALFGGLAADAGGRLYSIDGYNDPEPDRLFVIDRTTGGGSVVGPTGFNWNFRTLSFSPGTGTMYGARDNALFTMNIVTGAATEVGSISAPGGPLDQLTALAVDGQGRAFATDIGDTDLFSVDLATGQATFVASVGGSGNWFSDLAFDSNGVLWGVRLNGGVFTIDTATGAATMRFGGNYTGLVFVSEGPAPCYANCDGSTSEPILNVNDFICFQSKFAAQDPAANCDGSTTEPVLNVNDFICFQGAYAAGCP